MALGLLPVTGLTLPLISQGGSSLLAVSIGVGMLARDIWAPRADRKDGEFAMLCGLLHDMGKVVLFKKDAAHYSRLFSSKEEAPVEDIRAIQAQVIGRPFREQEFELRWERFKALGSKAMHRAPLLPGCKEVLADLGRRPLDTCGQQVTQPALAASDTLDYARPQRR